MYISAVRALGEYVRRHEEAGRNVNFVYSRFDEDVRDDIGQATAQSQEPVIVRAADHTNNEQKPFRELVRGRHSVRHFSPEAVADELLRRAISLSLRTPSVCNRQPARVRIISDKNLIAKLLKLQGGFGGYPLPPCLLLVTADMRAMMNNYERNEPYIDGGLFSMSLLYSLESMNLAACPLNTMFSNKVERQTRKLIAIPDNEVLIMYIAVGHYPDAATVCRSKRFELNRVLLDDRRRENAGTRQS